MTGTIPPLTGLLSGPLASAGAASNTTASDPLVDRPAATTVTSSSSPETPALAGIMLALAARQSGLGQLMTDLDQALSSAVLPAPVAEAASQVLSQRLPSDSAPTPASVAQAVATSGVFQEAAQAAGQPAPDLKSALISLGQMVDDWIAASTDRPTPPAPAPASPAQTEVAQAQSQAQPAPAPPAIGPAPLTPSAAMGVQQPEFAAPVAPPPAPASSAPTAPASEPPSVSGAASPPAQAARSDASEASVQPSRSDSADEPGPAATAPMVEEAAAPSATIRAAPGDPVRVASVSPEPAAVAGSPASPPPGGPASPVSTPPSSGPGEAPSQASAMTEPPEAITAPLGSAAPAETADSDASMPVASAASIGLLAEASPAAQVQSPAIGLAAAAPSSSATPSDATPPASTPSPARQAASAAPTAPPPSASVRQSVAPPSVQLPQLLALALDEDAAAQALALAPAIIPRAYRSASAGPDPTVEPERPATPPPPLRDSPLTGQRPASPSLPQDAPPDAVAQRLALLTRGALARQELTQIASLPQGGDDSSWLFELPLATPQGTAVAQLQVQRDKGRQSRGRTSAPAPVWRAKLALDIEPLGPVHAQAVLSEGHGAIALWAERPATAETLRGQQGQLAAALGAAGVPSEVTVYQGAPARTAASPGRLLDQAL